MTDQKKAQCFFAELNESMKLLRSECTSKRFGKNLLITCICFQMWYVFDFFLKVVVIIVQSGLKLYDLTVFSAGVQMNEFVIDPFAQWSHYVLV